MMQTIPSQIKSIDDLRGPAGRLEALLNTGRDDAPYAALVCHQLHDVPEQQHQKDHQEEEDQPDIDRRTESMDDIYRELREEFAMDSDAPSPASNSDSFADFVAKERATEARSRAR